LLLSFQEM